MGCFVQKKIVFRWSTMFDINSGLKSSHRHDTTDFSESIDDSFMIIGQKLLHEGHPFQAFDFI